MVSAFRLLRVSLVSYNQSPRYLHPTGRTPNYTQYIAQISAYMIFLGAFGLLWIFPIIFLDLIRRSALTSRIWVELIWVTIFWIMELSGAAALSAIVPSNHCQLHRGTLRNHLPFYTEHSHVIWALVTGRIAENVCLSGQVLLAFAWAVTLILLAYMIMLAVYTILHHATDPNIWKETVREYPWFSARSTLSSSPPSPTVEKGLGAPSLKHPRPKAAFDPSRLTRALSPFDDTIQPVSTFDRIPQPSYQPAQRSYDGLHFATTRDPPPIIDPVFTRPREAPKPPINIQSLYPEHMQTQLSIEVRNNLYGQSIQLEGQEPSPIGDWPKNSRNNNMTNGYGRRQPPPPFPRINTEAIALTQQPLSSISLDQRSRSLRTVNVSSPVFYKLGSPTRGPQSGSSVRKQPPPPLNLDGISNTSHHAYR
ncbi:hypothetical protein BDM02DRAFT_2366602 [Thelephora ganbajun]|uniref:Uncharacterized protein n=1 Tax=Thelephora ganbajun TaxID=370292 RepID=A0ACB6ZTE8_THEGA|nr:hypothetical protein BDM02DRAFT_2366602 [Thelephora ganbajun]